MSCVRWTVRKGAGGSVSVADSGLALRQFVRRVEAHPTHFFVLILHPACSPILCAHCDNEVLFSSRLKNGGDCPVLSCHSLVMPVVDISRPDTPDSPTSLRSATATIDELTAALTNYSHATSPEPPGVSTCCCGRSNCENSKCWAAFRLKLEERLILSAGEPCKKPSGYHVLKLIAMIEVGQALLQRHEAYLHQREVRPESFLQTLRTLNCLCIV